MSIQAQLDAVDGPGYEHLDASAKYLVRTRIRANVMRDVLRPYLDTSLIWRRGNHCYEVTFDHELAASFGHESPCFSHPTSGLISYVTIKRDGEIVFPTEQYTPPLVIVDAPFQDPTGADNPLWVFKDTVEGLVG